ncbi:MAG: hypothetical protein AUK34_05875 [Ignavibacteria bacterium CG2_30_36_16]|nr:DUF86 domain-containing protein [Ignavibacteria bacterium]OIP60882.1 MAG: hypothetical protein AUK34_05875 [Ignavibacteria bacterium CG2_30_36_16]PJB01941.1 MAG: hypothetical protein CO127_01220 [Ignavibacteria bacterium CG_4_9_14_3_um_filter_36_18]
MSKRDWRILFLDIIESINKIETYTKGMNFEDFSYNSLVIDAVVRNIEIIGEASKNISEDLQNEFKDIPWQKIKGIRNRIVHEYFSVDVTIIWFILENELAPIKISLTKHLNAN